MRLSHTYLAVSPSAAGDVVPAVVDDVLAPRGSDCAQRVVDCRLSGCQQRRRDNDGAVTSHCHSKSGGVILIIVIIIIMKMIFIIT